MSATPTNSIPVHVVTGFLGSGKTTLIRHLVEQKPEDERWAILINEFGQIGIDQAMFESHNGIVVKGLPGGCLCCQLAFVLQAALVNLLRRHRPDRLIIEPSGLGHPAGLLDVLRGEAFTDFLEVRDIIVLLDPTRLADPRARGHDTFNDQLAMADAVALTMADRVEPAQLTEARRHVETLWPPKKWMVEATHGELPVSLLLQGGRHREDGLGRIRNDSHAALRGSTQQAVLLDDFAELAPQPGQPLHKSGGALGYCTLSWRWSPVDVFDLDALSQLLDCLSAKLRIKGVLHTASGWKLYNRGDGAASLGPSVWRKDSRLELIGESEHMPQADALLEALQRCRLASREPGSLAE